MRTKITVAAIVVTCILAVLGGGVAAFVVWDAVGLLDYVMLGVGLGAAYALFVRSWHARWGATDAEVMAVMPGDELIPEGQITTRAITITATPAQIWPWIVQIGYGRAGWYSYDWIDNDGKPSARRILPEHQDLTVGTQIVMVPGMGPIVRELEPHRYLVAGDKGAGTWCLLLEQVDETRTRLVSRWRQDWKITPASLIWIAIADPGAFVMERKMLRGIKTRAEQHAREAPTR
jgi:hypothetical protein